MQKMEPELQVNICFNLCNFSSAELKKTINQPFFLESVLLFSLLFCHCARNK